MGHIFISYSHEDNTYGHTIVEALRKRGFSTWIDYHIETGERWAKAITDAILACDAFVVVMTPSAHESEWVEREILLAQSRHKPIFPLLLDGEEFPLLITMQFEDVQEGKIPSEKFFARLSRIIELNSTPPTDPHKELEMLKANVEDLEEQLAEAEQKLEEAEQKLEEYEEYEDVIEERKAQERQQRQPNPHQRTLFGD